MERLTSRPLNGREESLESIKTIGHIILMHIGLLISMEETYVHQWTTFRGDAQYLPRNFATAKSAATHLTLIGLV